MFNIGFQNDPRKFSIDVREVESAEKGGPPLFKLSIVNQWSIFTKVYETEAEVFKALDKKFADLLAKENSLTMRVVYANLRECVQALYQESLTSPAA